MTFAIRPAVAADREKIRPLQKEIADLHHDGRPDLFREEARYFTDEEFADRLNGDQYVSLIAEDDSGRVVGYALGWVISYRNHGTYVDHDCLYLDDICVLHDCRHRGIGRALMEACRCEAEKRGCTSLELSVWCFNRDAIAFYQYCGYAARTLRMECLPNKKD
jgi:diamine N-acetyltransferase